jgi:serine/threonine protein kinase
MQKRTKSEVVLTYQDFKIDDRLKDKAK